MGLDVFAIASALMEHARGLAFLICLAGCSSSAGTTVSVKRLVALRDSRASLQAYPDGTWEMILKCSTADGKDGAVVSRGTWRPDTTERVKEESQDPAVRAFASPLPGDGKCPQGDTNIFLMMLPTNEQLCWRSDPSNPMMPASILGLEKVFDDLITATQAAAGQTCSPAEIADTRPNFGSTNGGKISQGTPPVPAAGAPAPRP